MQEEHARSSEEGEGEVVYDINSRAYETVKRIWMRRGIWNRKWGMMLGTSWKHEEPFKMEDGEMPVSSEVI